MITIRIETTKILCLTFLTAILLVVNSCSVAKGRKISEEAVVRFHNQLNAGQYREIYAASDEGFRKATSEADTLALFEAVRWKLGTVKSSNQTGWRINATPAGTLVNLGYDVEFSESRELNSSYSA